MSERKFIIKESTAKKIAKAIMTADMDSDLRRLEGYEHFYGDEIPSTPESPIAKTFTQAIDDLVMYRSGTSVPGSFEMIDQSSSITINTLYVMTKSEWENKKSSLRNCIVLIKE